MLTRTKMITYNVHDRGRKHRGVDRKFDTVALAALINGPDVQERVKHGDMLGYFGHWPRVKFGMATQEGGILDGKVITLPTAIRTTHLSADEVGNITHQAEFLDTVEGRLAARLYESEAGGFSSAIDGVPRTSPTIPEAFYGFDYVLEPNYTTNRGHKAVLDSITSPNAEDRDDMLALLDAAMSESTAAAGTINALYDGLSAQHSLALDALARTAAENDLLIGRLAKLKNGSTVAVLDDIMGEQGQAPLKGTVGVPDYDRFRSMPLSAVREVKTSDDNSAEAGFLRRHYGMK